MSTQAVSFINEDLHLAVSAAPSLDLFSLFDDGVTSSLACLGFLSCVYTVNNHFLLFPHTVWYETTLKLRNTWDWLNELFWLHNKVNISLHLHPNELQRFDATYWWKITWGGLSFHYFYINQAFGSCLTSNQRRLKWIKQAVFGLKYKTDPLEINNLAHSKRKNA